MTPNARFQARRRAGARYERTLFAVACKPLFGPGWRGRVKRAFEFPLLSSRLLFRLPLLRSPLRLRGLSRRHPAGDIIAVMNSDLALCTCWKPSHRKIVLLVRFNVILKHALALSVHDAKIIQGAGVPLGGCLAVPLKSLGIVLRYACTQVI
jgi:hypothetical protein